MKVTNGFSPEDKRVIITVESNLMKKYFSNFCGLVKNNPDVPKDTDVTLKGTKTAIISFPLPDDAEVKRVSKDVGAIKLDSRKYETFMAIIDKFVSIAMRKELKKNEFIPLEGYSIENMSEEIHEAVKNKRNLCIIKDYSEFLAMQEEGAKYSFHQYVVEYGTDEYSNVAILIWKKDIEAVKEQYKDKLKLTYWF